MKRYRKDRQLILCTGGESVDGEVQKVYTLSYEELPLRSYTKSDWVCTLTRDEAKELYFELGKELTR